MSIDFLLGDDLLAILPSDAYPSQRHSRRRRGGTQAGRCAIALRKHCQLGQVEVAKLHGVRQPTVSGFKGTDPKLSTLQRYARALDARRLVF